MVFVFIWLVSLSLGPSRSTHMLLQMVKCSSSFLCYSWAFFLCIYTLHLPHPFLCWWTLQLFHTLAIVDNASMNTGVHASFQISVLSFLDIYPRVELLGHMVVLFLVFKETTVEQGPGGRTSPWHCQYQRPCGRKSSHKWLLSVRVPSESFCLWPLSEPLWDQQVGLIQLPFKRLPLPWALELGDSVCVPWRVESLFPTGLRVSPK